MAWPRIVAEALRRLDDRPPVVGSVRTDAPLQAIVAALDAARAPERCATAPPAFLYPHQHDPWRRVMATLDAWGGALLLESVGSGKTWIALAAAAQEPGKTVAFIPAILRSQWQSAAERADVPLSLWTHERTSRGMLPNTEPTLVIVDEAHRLRDPATRRVRTLAPWLAGRRSLLLTATPIVNRLGELISLLRLALPENALALDGIARLTDLELCSRPPSALRRLAIRSAPSGHSAVERRAITLAPNQLEVMRAERAIGAVDQLELSSRPSVKRLLRSVLLDAAASSDAAFYEAIKRYRALLLQSRDAGGASRVMLRRFAGPTLDQLVFWPLLNPEPVGNDLPSADIERAERLLLNQADDDGWIEALISQCDDVRPTICFARHRATARRLRTAWGDGIAWVAGSEAGIGPHRVARTGVLAAFGTGRNSWQLRRTAPRVLVATDVAAEGLDLQAAGRIVHVDLPWTATRLEQREGRALRLGQHHAQVEVVVRLPAPAIEAALAPQARVHRKRRMAEEWLRALAAPDAAVANRQTGMSVASFTDDDGYADMVIVQLRRERCSGVIVMTREGNGAWRADEGAAIRLVSRARTARPVSVDLCYVSATLASAARAATVTGAIDDGAPAALISRIHRLARQAAARRDGDTLRRLDDLLRFASFSPTLGDRAIMAELRELSDRDFSHRAVPMRPRRAAIHATAIAAIVFRSTLPPP